MTLRCVWHVKKDDYELAQQLISSKRLNTDQNLAKLPGINFFISSITGVTKNEKTEKEKKKQKKDEEAPKTQEKPDSQEEAPQSEAEDDPVPDDTPVWNPAIAYFISYTESPQCNEDKIYAMLHEMNINATVTPIRTRKRKTRDETELDGKYKVLMELQSVVKDHKNAAIQRMIETSNRFCFEKALASHLIQNPSARPPDDEVVYIPNFQHKAAGCESCRIYVINRKEFGEPLEEACRKLQSDGLILRVVDGMMKEQQPAQAPEPSNDISIALEKVKNAMAKLNHALCEGDIYAMPPGAKYTYVYMMDVDEYLNRILANEMLKETLICCKPKVLSLMSHHACAVIPQIKFDMDLIEVAEPTGMCFKISQRCFKEGCIQEEQVGKLSPRMYAPYDSNKIPDPTYFKEAIFNSFPTVKCRANFLNKFYQCLMCGKMPHKIPKLVVCGPKDSGKTSWASVFFGLIPRKFIASITQENQFSAAMINEDTQLVFLDEWSSNTLQSDMAKTVLQGGYLVKAVKHGKPVNFENKAPFFITTNEMPYFGNEDENVRRRVAIFKTKALPNCISNVDRWLRENAMECVAWIAEEIERERHHISKKELWYEEACSAEIGLPITDRGIFTGVDIANDSKDLMFDAEVIRSMTESDLKSQEKESAHVLESQHPSEFLSDQFREAADEILSKLTEEFNENRDSQEAEPVMSFQKLESTVVAVVGDATDCSESSIAPSGKARSPVSDSSSDADDWMLAVHDILANDFNRPKLSQVHVFAFRRGQRLNSVSHGPSYDAWMLVLGERDEKREFHPKLFLERYPEMLEKIKEIRRKVDVFVCKDNDPLMEC